MNNLTAAEALFLQEHLRSAIASERFLRHCAGQTNDTQFQALCQQFAADKQTEVQRMLPLLAQMPSMVPNV